MIEVDTFEPSEALAGLAQYVVTQRSLNEMGDSDYRWYVPSMECYRQVERKQWGEITASPDAVEKQLAEHFTNRPNDRHVLLIEGLRIPHHNGIAILRPTTKPQIYVSTFISNRSTKGVLAWMHRIQEFLPIVYTANYHDTLMYLGAAYENDQKEEHHTFNRNYSKVSYNPNPMVSKLMGMYPGVGEAKATAIISRFGTVWNVLNATVEELREVTGVGELLARRILKESGRPDIV